MAEVRRIRTHTGIYTYMDKEGTPLISAVAGCASDIRSSIRKEREYNGKKVEDIYIHIPEEFLKAIGKTPYQLAAWTDYLTRIGLPCELLSVKPQKGIFTEGNSFNNYIKKNTEYAAYIDRTPEGGKTIREYMLTQDSFFVVRLPLAEYRKDRMFLQFVTWTLLRTFYSNGFTNIVDYTFMFKALYPSLDRVKCLLMGHAGIHSAHAPDSDTKQMYGVYTPYHGLTSGSPSCKFISNKRFMSRMLSNAGDTLFVNGSATEEAKDGRNIFDLFDQGKFDELYKLALKDE